MEINDDLITRLEAKALQTRKDICTTANQIGYAHLGGGMSMTDVAVALYYDFLNFDPKNPNAPDRDRFVLSKGHCSHVLYNIFADLGMYTREEIYNEYNKINGRFGMHPNRLYLDGIEASTGSLGHGLPLSLGLALAARMNKENHRIVCMTGDGELQEGSNWEAIMAAGNFEMGNLLLIIDYNNMQVSGHSEEVMSLQPLEDKMRAFKWDVLTIDGHNMAEILSTLHTLPEADSQTRKKPVCIIAKTIKGKSISYIQDTPESHLVQLPDTKMQETLQSVETDAKARAGGGKNGR